MSLSKPSELEQVKPSSLWITTYHTIKQLIKEWFTKLVEAVLNPGEIRIAITAVVHTLTGVVLSTMTLFKKGTGYLMKIISGVNLLSTFELLLVQIGRNKELFTPDSAMRHAESKLSEYLDHSDSEEVYANTEQEAENIWVGCLSTILTTLFGALLAGFGLSTKGLEGLTTTFRAATTTKNGVFCIKELVDAALKIIAEEKFDPVYKERKAITALTEEAQVLLRLNLGAIASDNKVKDRYRTIIKDINQALTTYRHQDSANMRSLLATMVGELNKKLAEVEALIPTRQVTAGVYLQGEKGVGKSSLCNYLASYLAEVFDWSPSIYNISPGVKFYEPYLNEDFGILNEFGSTVDRDTFSVDANRICSSDPFNFESAGLAGKVSMCQLKALFVTTNVLNPDIKELQPNAVPAFWDRFIIIKVMDPLITDRRKQVNHRKSDFSHLSFRVYDLGTDENDLPKFRLLYDKLHISDILQILRTKLALETKAFYNRLNYPMPEALQKIIDLESNPPPGSYAFKYFGFQEKIVENSGGRDFCILRLQGPEGTGKTTLAMKLAERWMELTTAFEGKSRYTIQKSSSLEEFVPLNTPTIYVLDDWVTSNITIQESSIYVTKINATTNDSIFIITTNEIIKRRLPWCELPNRLLVGLLGGTYNYPYDMNPYKELYSGMRRRIGLDDLYSVRGRVHDVSSTEYCMVVTTDEKSVLTCSGKNVGFPFIVESIKQRFINMMENRYNITTIQGRPENELPTVDFEIKVANKDILFKKLSTSLGAASLYLKPDAEASLYVSERIISGIAEVNPDKAIRPSDFICKEVFDDSIPTDERYTTIVERITRVLLQYFKDPTFRVVIQDEKRVVYSENGVVYYYEDKEDTRIAFEGYNLIINLSTPKMVFPYDFAAALVEDRMEKKFVGTLSNLTAAEYTIIEKYYKRSITSKKCNPFLVAVATRELQLTRMKDPKYVKGLLKLQNNYLLKLGLCGLAGVGSVALLYGVYKLIASTMKQEEEKIKDNAFANVGSTPPKRAMNNQSNKDKQRLGATLTDPIIENSPHHKHRGRIIPNKKRTSRYATTSTSSSSETTTTSASSSDEITSDSDSSISSDSSVKPEPITIVGNPAHRIIGNSAHTKNRGTIIPNNHTREIKRVDRAKKENEDYNKVPHEHVCTTCGCLFTHIHKFNKNFLHPTYQNACPNYKCASYHGGNNKYNAKLIQADFINSADEPLTPNAMTKLMGEEYAPVKVSLLEFFSALPSEERKQVYDYINQARDANDRTFARLCRKYPGLENCIMKAVHANMLTDADMITNDDTDLEILHKKLNKAYVQVNYAGFRAYALHVGEGKFLTVAHCFDSVGRSLVLLSEGKSYPGVVVSITRERDLSVVYCKELSNLRSAKSAFVKDSSDLVLGGYFMRCGPCVTIVSGNIEYREYQEFIDGSCSNEYYRPSMEVLKLRRVGLVVTETIRKGDCGFPFVARINGTMRIIGIHNAYKTHTVVFGAFISQPLIEELCSVVVPNADVPSTAVVVKVPVIRDDNYNDYLEMSMPMEYAEEFKKCFSPDPYMPKNSGLTSIGFNQKFRNYNHMKEKHFTHELTLENANTCLPAAFSDRYVTDTSELVKNGFGKPDPLWTQACKYGRRNKNYDRHIFRHAVEMALDYNKMTYCAEKPFKFLTEFEALNGRTEPFLSNVDITTSAGPYAKYFHNIYTKRDILDTELADGKPIYKFAQNRAGQSIRNHLKSQRNLLAVYGIPPCLISQDNAKVENIEKEKAQKGKVRLFNNVDPAVNAILKIMFGDWFSRAMAKSSEGYYAIGQNPYTTSTEIWHRFSTKQGKILNTDFKAFDKLLITELIEAFCYIGGELTKNEKHPQSALMYEAISLTLIHAVHILNGSVYVVNNGNESGTFVTTLLNCVSVHIIFNYSFIVCWNKVPSYVHIKPLLKDIMSRSELAILGDDKTQVVSKDIPMEEEDLIDIAASLGMECTKAKGGLDDGKQINFCSRVLVWDEVEQIVYPRLKKSSIIGLLYWFASLDKNQVRDNLMIALFEASLHEREFYDSVLRDAMLVSLEFGVDIRTVAFTNYSQSRQRLKSMLMNDFEYQQISALADRKTKESDYSDLIRILKTAQLLENDIQKAKTADINNFSVVKNRALAIQKYTTTSTTPTTGSVVYESEMAPLSTNSNPISACLELISKLKTAGPVEHFERAGPPHSPTYSCTVTYAGRHFGGEGPSKASAKTQAYGALRQYLEDHIVCNAACEDQRIEATQKIRKVAITAFSFYIENHINTAINNADGKKYIIIIGKRSADDTVEQIDGFYKFHRGGNCYILSPIIEKLGRKTAAECYRYYPGVSFDSSTNEVTLDVHASTSNYSLRDDFEKDYTDDDHLVFANSAEDKPILGVMENDDPQTMPVTSVMDSDKALYQPIIMNRSAPNNSWLRAGGITFNIHDLVYNQFVGCNKQITVGDGTAAGTILAQIPYDPVDNPYANGYIQNLVLLHGRMTGDWMIKITCPGNPGMQCSIGVGWSPTKISETTVPMDVITKYAFFTTGVSSEWSHTIVMTDARQNNFYRTIQRDSKKTQVDDVGNMPHIVIFCETPPTSVYTEKKSTYLTFFSKLCSENDLMFNPSIKPFVLADPQQSVKYDARKGYSLNF
ncbi:protein P1 [Acyrthosiphon pisum virus]|uniref:protein P1 n=1 Tax=Acyrthosiphon pisum virus TaxID=340187 RepID=UPI00000F73C5|nr:protein P1 [Acyrthosiphon pisum virus]AAC58718.1 protein P1 [Acyrthosiphon pisum virus]